MNTFYYFEGNIYETIGAAEYAARNYNIKRIDSIKTEKSFDEFETAFEEVKKECSSDVDAIEWAK